MSMEATKIESFIKVKTKSIVGLIFIILAFTAALLLIAQSPDRSKSLFVNGFVLVPVVNNQTQHVTEIALPQASVYLVEAADTSAIVGSAETDLSGRFTIKTRKTGLFRLCAEAKWFPRTCPEKRFEIQSKLGSVRYGNLLLPIQSDQKSAVAYGTVTLADGSRPRGFWPTMGINAYALVEFKTPGGAQYQAVVNNLGEYIVPSIPVSEDFRLSAIIEKEILERRISKQTNLQPSRNYEFDFELRNHPPRIRVVSAGINGRPIQIAKPGSTVILTAVAEDRDSDKLQYRWLLPDGSVSGPSDSPQLKFTIPNRTGLHRVGVVVSDGRGGYSQDAISINATNGNVPFSGTVVDQGGVPITGALIEVNERLMNTNSAGLFSLEVPVSDRYAFTIHKSGLEAPNQPAFASVSYVYTGSIVGGRWVLRRAQVSTHDPTQTIQVEHKRSEHDCEGSAGSRINWRPYLQPGVVDWQDGRGNTLSLKDLGQRDLKAVQGVARLLGRVSPLLARHFVGLTGREGNGLLAKADYGRGSQFEEGPVPCLGGIRVEIPPNSLIDMSTKKAPIGKVQIALSTVDLTTAGSMPGDYSAIDDNKKSASMESYGAGSIEIGSGNARYNLKQGKTATVTIPVDGTQIAGHAKPPATIPFLFYDETKGVWNQDGVATLTGSGANAAYVKQVKHFSTMNSDILKKGQSCVAVEVDPLANFVLPLNVEVTLPPSVVNPTVIQVRPLVVDSTKSNVIYNLPNNTNIVLTPIIQGKKPDGSTGDVPAGVFVVNTGGPQSSATNLPQQNNDGSYYAESNGHPTGPCGARVTLKKLNGPSLAPGFEFLQGFYFEASNITELQASDPTVATAIQLGAANYYNQADPRGNRASFKGFLTTNKFGQPLGVGEVEFDAQYANSGDLGFGRDMHCRRNVASDMKNDYACYVTNYGQPVLGVPNPHPDQVDADNALSHTSPDATVCMEYSRVENPKGDPQEFPDNQRAVKFYVYDSKTPDATPPIAQADLDSFGDRPVPQLCVICHGGQVSSQPADMMNPNGPRVGAFASRADILSMNSNFLAFDLHLYNFPAAKLKGAQQTAFKNLNTEIVRKVAVDQGSAPAIVELIDAWYLNNSPSQIEDAVIANWDAADPNSNSHKFYRDVFSRTCRTCHVAKPFTAPVFTNKDEFKNDMPVVQNRVCNQKVMPHAKRTNDIFWTSIGPNMPAFLQLYGQTLPGSGWDSTTPAEQCGLFFQGGADVQSEFTSVVYPILSNRCISCHSVPGNAKWSLQGGAAATYNSLLNATANDGTSKYIVPNNPAASLLYQKISHGPDQMPQGGPDLTVTGNPPEATQILNWINNGAVGP